MTYLFKVIATIMITITNVQPNESIQCKVVFINQIDEGYM